MKGWLDCPDCHGTGMAITWNDNGGRVYEICDNEPEEQDNDEQR